MIYIERQRDIYVETNIGQREIRKTNENKKKIYKKTARDKNRSNRKRKRPESIKKQRG
jgi:hypothetical protein